MRREGGREGEIKRRKVKRRKEEKKDRVQG